MCSSWNIQMHISRSSNDILCDIKELKKSTQIQKPVSITVILLGFGGFYYISIILNITLKIYILILCVWVNGNNLSWSALGFQICRKGKCIITWSISNTKRIFFKFYCSVSGKKKTKAAAAKQSQILQIFQCI